MPTRTDMLSWIQNAFAAERDNLEPEIKRWRSQFTPDNALFGYSVTKWPLQYAVVAAFLYEQTGDRTLAELACETMLRYRDFTKIMPPEAAAQHPEYAGGVPPLDNCFDPVQFCPTVERIRPAISKQEDEALAQIMADSLRMTWLFPEWGGHNRAMLRAASLASAAHAWPHHPNTAKWLSMADELAEESWGRWSIEDAMLYQTHWLRAVIIYAEARGKSEIAGLIQPRLHLKAMTQLITPLGILPDFGDSHWLMHSAWEWMACLEWGAHTYHDPTMKWTAQRIWEERQSEKPNIYAAMVLATAHRWCNDTIAPRQPYGTPDALDDLVTKKVVFRTGWDKDATYACVNYRDEGDYGRVDRDYLRANLAVSAEKMHHGHADEGSFVSLIHKQTILLHESGYRESPPDGIYRADFYHNRLIWRRGARLPETDTLDYMHDNGHYKPVRTERLYQTRLLDAEISRLRISDERRGVQWDRSIFFLPTLPAWVVIDTALALHTEPRTFAALWWTTDILERGDNWFETHIARITDWQNRKDAALMLVLPKVPGHSNALNVYPYRRFFQQEQVIVNSWTGEHRVGSALNFVSILLPHDMADMNAERAAAVQVVASKPAGRGLAVRLAWQGEERLLCTLNDLTCGYLQEDIRPRYTFEQGKTAYDQITSDAAFVYLREGSGGGQAGFINGTRLDKGSKVLYQGPLHDMFQENRTSLPGVPARFRWEGAT